MKTETYQVVRQKVAVDGDTSDWKTIPPVIVRGEKHLWFGQGMTREKWHGNEDLSYSWRAAWWANKLYFLIEVTDDKVVPPSQPSSFLCDGVEIFLDYGNRGGQRVKLLDGRADWFAKCDPKELMGYELHFLPSSPPQVYLDHRDKYATDKSHNGEFARRWHGEVVSKRTTKGYVLEIGFSVPDLTLKAGQVIGVQLGVNDDDGTGRKSIMMWPATKADFWLTMDGYAKFTLVEGTSTGADVATKPPRK